MTTHISITSPHRIATAARALSLSIERGQRVDAALLRSTMQSAFAGADADGAWDWKSSYDACEAATVLFLRKFWPALCAKAVSPPIMLPLLERIADLLPSHTVRSQESQALQQFSTPIPLGYVASTAAGITSGDRVLEPSAGTGLLAIFAELAEGTLVLNELAETRSGLLRTLFPRALVTGFDGAQIDDHLDPAIDPTIALINPPFSAMPHVDRRISGVALKHIGSALARLRDGGRLVAITGAGLAPENPTWRDAFVRLQERAQIVFSAPIDGAVYARHGTRVPVRLTVFDKVPADDPSVFPDPRELAPDVVTLLGWVMRDLPSRPATAQREVAFPSLPLTASPQAFDVASEPAQADMVDLSYDVVDWIPDENGRLTDALYETYTLQSIRLSGAQPHPTKLVQSAAMASVPPPKPSYRPRLPSAVISNGLLSDAQLESVIYAGEAHRDYLAGSWTADATYDVIAAARDDNENGVRFRKGWFLGDGTGAGKGRQIAGILLDNWLKGRRRALWISKSDKLIEDAQRDWSALGMERLLITPLSRFRQGTPVRLAEGILFTTYATLRSDERGDKASRVQQITDWLGSDFDGVVVFDESHALQNAAGSRSERGDQAASQQGRAGLRLQHALPDARVVYVSATGATNVHNLAYAQRLGLWGGKDFPFATRAEFVAAIEAGGVAAMEVLARDLKALGLYASRSLSYEGVAYELVEHRLTSEQISIYDAYAAAFRIIHHNLNAAMEAANITAPKGVLNSRAKAAARSAFESAKQRFFNHLITAMKTPSLIAAVEQDLKDGHAAVIQIVSTGEALLDRRLAEIPTEEWHDVQVDITPREYVLDYLAHSFPVQLYEPYTADDDTLSSRPVMRDGQPVLCREAIRRRDRMIESLASLPAVPGALDQIVQRFGTEIVAEVTGRSRRIVRKRDRLAVETRPGSANLSDAQAFMDDLKHVLVFSDAGGTGRSYHAELSAKNRRLRIHYLLEAGWKADTAIQGLGRTNRTNQAQPPVFRPIATDVKAEKRFLSTIARRLDTLGAITRGQRQTGGQGLFRSDDNLESAYARDALRQFYLLLSQGKVPGCSLDLFQDATGLDLVDENGLKDDLPSISTFLNRLLALTIELQNCLFTVFEQLLAARLEGAAASGLLDWGLETLAAESFIITDRRTIYTHPDSRAESRLLTVAQRQRIAPVSLEEAIGHLSRPGAQLLINRQSGRAAVQIPAATIMLDNGEAERRIRLIRPLERPALPLAALRETSWQETDRETFTAAWGAELAEIPEFSKSTLHIVAGLLLPIWKLLPNESARIYRLQTDDGERVIGRRVSPEWAAAILGAAASPLSPDQAFAALKEGKLVLELAQSLQLRRVRVMGAERIELSGFSDAMRDRLRAYGLFHEIISWKLRMFVPTGDGGGPILTKVLETYPIARAVYREAA